MKDEIKEIEKMTDITEILDYLKKYFELRPSETELLLDYITNLQQENETLKGSSTSTKQWLYKQNKSRLDANLKLVDERDKYKSRNEKATKHIDDWLFETGGNGACMDYEDIIEIKNILNGGDEE